ncbi:hypothetical protein TNCV_1708181 [Trichonephila clavipes]|nr:hypothetical protein TNCV_1708181 [Trichonephila clavipes]
MYPHLKLTDKSSKRTGLKQCVDNRYQNGLVLLKPADIASGKLQYESEWCPHTVQFSRLQNYCENLGVRSGVSDVQTAAENCSKTMDLIITKLVKRSDKNDTTCLVIMWNSEDTYVS